MSGTPIYESWGVPRDRAIHASDPGGGGAHVIFAHPSAVMVIRNGGRTPLWTRHMLGVREAERDRRRRAKRAAR